MMKSWLKILLFCYVFCFFVELKADFFSKPELISPEEVRAQLQEKTLEMYWQGEGSDLFYFSCENDDVYFEIDLNNLPLSYEPAFCELFLKTHSKEEGNVYVYSYEWKQPNHIVRNQPRAKDKEMGADSSSYIVLNRRIFEHCAAQPMEEDQLRSILVNSKVLFYTGAGMSVASEVPAMKQLNDMLHIKVGPEFAESLKWALSNPEAFSQEILKFKIALYTSPPTKAHEAIKRLSLVKGTRIVTENLDCLHELTGIAPYRVNANHLREEVGGGELHNYEYVICIGLSYDDKGFLGWYKQNNPKGKIIAIDIGNPSYLGPEDYLIHADLQILLPELANGL